jgi:DNA-directed RNA polymerase subunit N (RpoN/RPB10)
MLTPIVCTCGMPIGDIAVLFLRMRAARVREVLGARGTAPTQAAVDAGLQIECGDILDLLQVTYDCCRARLVTNMQFLDYY